MISDNFTENILSNPQYLDLKNGKYLSKRKTKKISISVLFIIILSIIPLSFIYTIGTGFTIGGYNYFFSKIFDFSLNNIDTLLYYLILGIIGNILIVVGFYLTSLLIKIVNK